MTFKEKCNCKYIHNQQNRVGLDVNIDADLRTWLNEIGNSTVAIDWSSEHLYLSGLKSINAFQEGYAGNHWKSSWVVFGKWIGDPIIYNIENGEILTSMHGIGEWNPYPISPTLETFDLILFTWCSLHYDKYNGVIYDDDFGILQEFIVDFRKNLLKIINIEYVNGFLKFINS